MWLLGDSGMRAEKEGLLDGLLVEYVIRASSRKSGNSNRGKMGETLQKRYTPAITAPIESEGMPKRRGSRLARAPNTYQIKSQCWHRKRLQMQLIAYVDRLVSANLQGESIDRAPQLW